MDQQTLTCAFLCSHFHGSLRYAYLHIPNVNSLIWNLYCFLPAELALSSTPCQSWDILTNPKQTQNGKEKKTPCQSWWLTTHNLCFQTLFRPINFPFSAGMGWQTNKVVSEKCSQGNDGDSHVPWEEGGSVCLTESSRKEWAWGERGEERAMRPLTHRTCVWRVVFHSLQGATTFSPRKLSLSLSGQARILEQLIHCGLKRRTDSCRIPDQEPVFTASHQGPIITDCGKEVHHYKVRTPTIQNKCIENNATLSRINPLNI